MDGDDGGDGDDGDDGDLNIHGCLNQCCTGSAIYMDTP